MKKNNLEKIAKEYHLSAKLNDMHIENFNQNYYAKWLLKYTYNKKILEMGFGDGILTGHLSKSSSQIDLIEGSSLLANKAKKKFKKIKVINTMFEEFFPKKNYDVILASHILEHVDNPVKILKKISTWMHKKSICIIHVPIRSSYHRQLAVIMKLQKKLDSLSKRDHIVGHKRVYSINRMKLDLKKSGMHIKEIKGFFVKFLPNSMMINFSNKLLFALNKIAEKIDPSLCANVSFVVMKKKFKN